MSKPPGEFVNEQHGKAKQTDTDGQEEEEERDERPERLQDTKRFRMCWSNEACV